jgi:hypothetical protein
MWYTFQSSLCKNLLIKQNNNTNNKIVNIPVGKKIVTAIAQNSKKNKAIGL